jgi:hypothetical protein
MCSDAWSDARRLRTSLQAGTARWDQAATTDFLPWGSRVARDWEVMRASVEVFFPLAVR